jgi:hypothetical protein
MQELIRIESVPAKLGANFEEVRTRLQTELANYDVLVTLETLPGAKKLATELNQMAKTIDDRRKQEVASVSEPIRAFDDQMKELVTMCKDGRQKLTDQIKTFEDETRETARALLDARRTELWDHYGIEAEFRKATYDDLVMLTAVTKTGKLAAKASNDLESRVLADKSLQDRTARRLLELENASYKAGLSAPLTRDHVAGFLMADDATYAGELERIIDAEIRREEEAQRRMREKLEREQREKEAREQAERDRIERENRERAEREAQRAEAMKNAGMQSHAGMANAGMQSHAGMANSEEAKDWNRQGEEHDEPEWVGVDMAEPEQDIPLRQTHSEPAEPAPGKVQVTVYATFQPEVPAGATDEQIKAALRRTMANAGINTLTSIEIERPAFMEAAE